MIGTQDVGDIIVLVIAGLLLVNGGAGLVRTLRGPTPADRLVSIQLLATTGLAVLLLLADAMSAPIARHTALLLATLAAVAGLAFARRLWARLQAFVESGEEEET